MGSLLEELVRREAAARERAEAIREQIDHLGQRPAAEEELLSRLVVVSVDGKGADGTAIGRCDPDPRPAVSGCAGRCPPTPTR
ncbi:hypothetical protein GCM10023075_83980 [Streptosporangium album]